MRRGPLRPINEATGQEGDWRCHQASGDKTCECTGQSIAEPRIRIVVAGCCGRTCDRADRRARRYSEVEVSHFVVVTDVCDAGTLYFEAPSVGPGRRIAEQHLIRSSCEVTIGLLAVHSRHDDSIASAQVFNAAPGRGGGLWRIGYILRNSGLC